MPDTRGQKTEDRRQSVERLCRAFVERMPRSGNKTSVLCLLPSVL
ncbi:MAG: hypothetical protein NUV63_01230 [Gallionella sp.]|nr:hypothetical protein [Gallionella sp.]